MRLSRRSFVGLALGAAAGVAGTALVSTQVAAPRVLAQGGELNLYSSRHYITDDTLFSAFTEQTGIRVNLIEGTEDQLIERIKAEGANSPADVMITVDAGRLWRAQEAGLFQPLRSAVLESRIPPHLREPEGHWFGYSMRARVIAYANERVDPAALSTYEALADPRWQGKLLVRSSSNVYNQSLVGSLIEANGLDATEQWARGVVGNFARAPQGGDSDQLKALAAGEGDVAISNHYYWARLVNSDDADERAVAAKVSLFFPNQGPGERGTHMNVSGAGMIANAPNRESAVAFLEYLASDSAQELFAKGNYEFPAVEGTPLHETTAGLGAFKMDPLSASVFGRNNQLGLLIMNRAGWR
jgi:iron(III) transport system substrate-binding protein